MPVRVINGKRYDTETAVRLASASSYVSERDPGWWAETLFRKRSGEFFLHGHGGPRTRWATAIDRASWESGEDLVPLSDDQAREWTRRYLSPEEYAVIFSTG